MDGENQFIVALVVLAITVIGLVAGMFNTLRQDIRTLDQKLDTERDERHKLGERVARLEGIQSHQNKEQGE